MADNDNMNTGEHTYTLPSNYGSTDTITISDVHDVSTISVGSGLLDDIVTAPNSDFTWDSSDLEIEFNGNKRNLRDLAEKVDRIEERLGIFKIDPELEQEWEQLKSLGDQYRELEQKILEKKKVWNILKDE